MNLRASIDIGSNSILLLLAEVLKGGGLKVLKSESRVTGLGRELDQNGMFIEEALRDSQSALKEYSKICKEYGLTLSEIPVTATEASRVAKNAKDFFKTIKETCGFDVKIITAQAEAYYSATGILFDKKITDKTITIMDIGGASTELIKVNTETQEVLYSFSMPIGVVRMNNWHEKGTRESRLSKILEDYRNDLAVVACTKLYCVAGTMTSIGNMHLKNKLFDEKKVNGLSMESRSVKELLHTYIDFSHQSFLEAYPFLGKRSKTIASGLLLAQELLKNLEVDELYISTFGLRYGTILAGEIKNDFLTK